MSGVRDGRWYEEKNRRTGFLFVFINRISVPHNQISLSKSISELSLSKRISK